MSTQTRRNIGKSRRLGLLFAVAAVTTFASATTSSASTAEPKTDTPACRAGLASISTNTGITCFEGKGMWHGAIPGVVAIRGGATDSISVNINDDCCTAGPGQQSPPITPPALVQDVQIF